MLKANRSLQDRTMSFLAPKTFSKDFHEMGKKKNILEWPCSARFGSIMGTDYPSNPFWVMTSSQPLLVLSEIDQKRACFSQISRPNEKKGTMKTRNMGMAFFRSHSQSQPIRVPPIWMLTFPGGGLSWQASGGVPKSESNRTGHIDSPGISLDQDLRPLLPSRPSGIWR